MKRSIALALAAAALLLVSCGRDHADLPTAFMYDPPPTPTNFSAAPGPERCALSWSYPPEAVSSLREFRVYLYYEYYGLLELVGTTTGTTFVHDRLVGNLVYCYAVSAVDTTGLEGWRTESVCALVPTGL